MNTPERYNLKWNLHSVNFIQSFSDFQNTESLVDVTLFCEGQYIKAHKLVLSACSSYFHSIFQAHRAWEYPIIYLNGVTFKALNYILRFMYNGEVKILVSDLPEVLALGESLKVKGLCTVKMAESDNGEIFENVDNRANTSQANDSQYLLQKREFEIKQPEVQRPKTSLALPELRPASQTASNNPPPAPNAFMLFTKKQRPKLSSQYPGESTKDISIRLGTMWKNMPPEEKTTYYQLAQQQEDNFNKSFQVPIEPRSKRKLMEGRNSAKKICVDPASEVETYLIE